MRSVLLSHVFNRLGHDLERQIIVRIDEEQHQVWVRRQEHVANVTKNMPGVVDTTGVSKETQSVQLAHVLGVSFEPPPLQFANVLKNSCQNHECRRKVVTRC
uniref:Uncharacterized protein n=1 Tax=Proboscia inermis TaxID=420281 RepID=A0A7S0C8H8_9STRA